MAIYDIGGEYRDIDTEEQIYTAIEDKMSYEFATYIREGFEEDDYVAMGYKDERDLLQSDLDDLTDRIHEIEKGLRNILKQVDGNNSLMVQGLNYSMLVDTLRDFVNETF